MDRKGDLGDPSEVTSRVVFVWEDLLARLKPGTQAAEERALKYRMWKRAFRLWQEDDVIRASAHDAAWRLHQVIDVLVTHPEPFAELVRDHLDQTSFVYGRFLNMDLEGFQRWLPRHPEVQVVWHGYTHRPFLFGSRGAMLDKPGRLTAHG